MCASTAAASSGAWAATSQEIAQVESDAYPGLINHFMLNLDSSGDVVGITYNGTDTFSLQELRDTVVLLHNDSPSLDVVKLDVDDAFTAQSGGLVNIYYLINAFRSHTYGVFPMDLVRTGDHWTAFLHERGGCCGPEIHQLYFHANRFFGHIVGVSRVSSY